MKEISIWLGAIMAGIGLISLLIAGIVLVRSAIRVKVDDSWENTARRRAEDLKDAREQIEGLEAKLKMFDQQNDLLTSRAGRALAKVDWYEARYGSIPVDKTE